MRLSASVSAGCVIAAVCALVSPSLVGAQTCLGLPGPEGGRIQLGAGYMSSADASQFGLSAGVVSSRFLGQLSTATVNFDALRGYARAEGVSLGYRLPIGTRGRTEMCPVVDGSLGEIVSRGNDPRNVEEFNNPRRIALTRGASAGVSLGHRMQASNSFAVVPAVSASYVHSAVRQDQLELRNSINYGSMRFSVGLLLGTRFTASPSVSVPFALDGASRSLGLAFTVGLKPKKP